MKEWIMEVIHERCAGLDVHKETVVGCVRVSERGAVRHEVRRFATTTAGLLELGDWLRQAGCTHVAMEATGVYWKPVWHTILPASTRIEPPNAWHAASQS